MNQEAILEVKRLADEHDRAVRGVLLGIVEAPDFETVASSELTLEQRYEALVQRMDELTSFTVDRDYPGWETSSGVQVATLKDSATPDVWLRFRRSFLDNDGMPSVLVAEYFDAPRVGVPNMGDTVIGFKTDLGQALAYESISQDDLPADSAFRDRWPGEDPRTPEQRMRLMEQAVDLYQQGLAAQQN